MRPVLFIQEPAVIVQKFQNIPHRHDINIRVFYTYVKRFFENISLFLKDYFLAFFLGSGCFALGGRPLPGTTFIASKSSSVYKASCEKGLRPALRRRLLTVSLGSLSLSAISEIVIPFMPHIIGILRKNLKNVHYREQLLNKWIVKIRNFLKNVHKKGYFTLTKCSF
jgi:hypothetical protein